ncbi:hypothetical protein WJX74_007989 [Apatococcus lobatus]|uniref:Zinc-finger domain-containing protein n=1 Tax=Apatococcus lobatus TaxID=904363 RepID=A0AAW1RIK3_9CHLO
MLSQYEQERADRIAQNQLRLKQLGLHETVDQFARVAGQPVRRRAAPRPKRPITAEDLAAAPRRRSERGAGKAAVNYDESALDRADGSRTGRAKREGSGKALVLVQGPTKESYTQEQAASLGSCEEPWDLFVDGYDAAGQRVYDKIEGKTCHQCRQKTICKHTSCSSCELLVGVFCGDCLYMRYGENLNELDMAKWVCPVCRGICNCSFHRSRRGWAPTGSMYRSAIAAGYKSVAHFLVLTHLDESEDQGPVTSSAAESAAEPPLTNLTAVPPEESVIEVVTQAPPKRATRSSSRRPN